MNQSKEKSAVGIGVPATEQENYNTNSIPETEEKIKTPLKVLVACEESQRVCMAFRKLGHEAYSCDIQEPSGGHPEWHILGDVLEILNSHFQYMAIHYDIALPIYGIRFKTMDDEEHLIEKWDLIIAHPPCTYLTNAAVRHHSLKCSSLESINGRTFLRIEAMQFFMNLIDADCEHIAVENPVGVMNTAYRQADQIIHPYFFAENEDDTENYVQKRTCLWLKNLPVLQRINNLPPPKPMYYCQGEKCKGKAIGWCEGLTAKGGQAERAKARSKTFEGIARAMAIQWGSIVMSEKIKSKICQSAKEHGEIVDFQTITNNSFIIEYRDGEKQWYCNVDSDSIAAIYDIVKKLMY